MHDIRVKATGVGWRYGWLSVFLFFSVTHTHIFSLEGKGGELFFLYTSQAQGLETEEGSFEFGARASEAMFEGGRGGGV